jgi:hypothetical protein
MLTPKVSDGSGEERPSGFDSVGQGSSTNKTPGSREPRWPAGIALLAVGGLRLALPPSFSAGPKWLLLAVVAALMLPTLWALYCRLDGLNKALGNILISIVTADIIWSLSHHVAAFP